MSKILKKRYLCIFLPYFQTDLIKRQTLLIKRESNHIQRNKALQHKEEESSLILSSGVSGQPVVMRCCEQSEQSGVSEQMSLSLAQALAPQAAVFPFRPQGDYRQLKQLASWAQRFTPLVAIDEELEQAALKGKLQQVSSNTNGLVLDITGTQRLFGSEEKVLERIAHAFERAEFSFRLSVAPSIASAWALSRYSEKQIVYCDEQNFRQQLISLPLHALRLEEKAVLELHELGLFRIEQLLELPSKKLSAAFGAVLTIKLDQLFAKVKERFQPIQRVDLPELQRVFDIPLLRRQSIQRACVQMLEQLLDHLKQRGQKSPGFLLDLYGKDIQGNDFSIHKELLLNSANAHKKKLLALLVPVIENARFRGGIDLIRLRCEAVQNLSALQLDADGGYQDQLGAEDFEQFLSASTLRLGAERIKTLSFQESYIPERAFRYEELKRNYRKELSHRAPSPRIPLDCPSQIFETPQQIKATALLPDHPPSLILWKGKRYRIVRGTGPERVSGEWWKNASQQACEQREYFKVQDTSGRWLWIFRDRNSLSWFLHGVWS